MIRTRKTGGVEYGYDEIGNLVTKIRLSRTGSVIETNEYTYIEVGK